MSVVAVFSPPLPLQQLTIEVYGTNILCRGSGGGHAIQGKECAGHR